MRIREFSNGLDSGRLLQQQLSAHGQHSLPLSFMLVMAPHHSHGCLRTGHGGKFLNSFKMVTVGDLKATDTVMTIIT